MTPEQRLITGQNLLNLITRKKILIVVPVRKRPGDVSWFERTPQDSMTQFFCVLLLYQTDYLHSIIQVSVQDSNVWNVNSEFYSKAETLS